MNTFATKIIFYGTVALAAGCLTLTVEMPGAVWRALAMWAIGCVLIYVGSRNLFDGADAQGSRLGLEPSNPQGPGARVSARAIVADLQGRPSGATAAAERGQSVFATLAVVLLSAAAIVIGICAKIAEEREKVPPKPPVREVLDPLPWNPGKEAAEALIISSLGYSNEEQQVVAEARRLVQAAEYPAAIALLTKRVEKGNWFAGRLFYLGYALYHTNRNREAVLVLSRLIAIQEMNEAYKIYRREARYFRARALMALDRPQEAEADLSYAIEVKSAVELHLLRALAHEKLGNTELAAQDRQRAAELDPPLKRQVGDRRAAM